MSPLHLPSLCWYILGMNNGRPKENLEIIKKENILNSFFTFKPLNTSRESKALFIVKTDEGVFLGDHTLRGRTRSL